MVEFYLSSYRSNTCYLLRYMLYIDYFYKRRKKRNEYIGGEKYNLFIDKGRARVADGKAIFVLTLINE